MALNTQRGTTAASLPVEDFLQSLGAQLDRAQDFLALKVKAGRPLTWALKDISLDLQVFVEQDPGGRIRWRHVAPNEQGASRINLTFTTITRPMVEENTWSTDLDADPRSLDELRGQEGLSETTRQRLDMAGVRSVGQLRRLADSMDPRSLQTYLGSPVDQLMSALNSSTRPVVSAHEVVPDGDGPPLVRIYGANLSDGTRPEVTLNGEPIEVVDARPERLLVRPLSHHKDGQIEVTVRGERVTGFVRLPTARGGARMAEPPAPAAPVASAPTESLEPLRSPAGKAGGR